jgi:divalent metal cation (Fe/Co/Zn/Cd) transporter
MFSKTTPTSRFTYGYGRVEGFAGIQVVLTSAVVARYEQVFMSLFVIKPLGTASLWQSQ